MPFAPNVPAGLVPRGIVFSRGGARELEELLPRKNPCFFVSIRGLKPFPREREKKLREERAEAEGDED